MKLSLSKALALIALVVLISAFAGVAIDSYAGAVSFPKPRTKTLTESSATGFVSVSVQSNQTTSGIVHWTIYATDGTDYQTRTGATYFAAVNKAGTVTCAVGDIGTTVAGLSSGTLTNTMTCTAGTNKLTINANAASSLTQTTLLIRYQVEDVIGPSTATGL
jgi:hypothetical protein